MAASTSEPAARPVLAASVGVVRDGRVLVASRTQPPGKALFSFPGGRVERGESLMEAALRELREEVDVVAEIAGFLTHVETIVPDESGGIAAHFVVCAFSGRWIAGEGTPGPEAGEVRWVTLEELAALPTTRGLLDIARRAMAQAQGREP
jgi:8-oxo-dGTP diphosphatase